jgi:hypothetical protein
MSKKIGSLVTLFLLFLFISPKAEAVTSVDDVPVIEAVAHPIFSNIPRINKEFLGEANETDKNPVIEKCKKWVFDYVQKISHQQIFEAACLYHTDVVMRRHVITGQIILQKW